MHRLWLFAALLFAVSPARASYIDNINGSATPGSNLTNTVTFDSSVTGVGWYYTPSFSYTLDGIFTNFGQASTTVVTPTITVQLQTERPVNGGTVLEQGTFQGNSASGGFIGTSLGPVSLVAGTTYFVDLLNVTGMGVDYGQWQNNESDQPQPSNGATVNLGTVYVTSPSVSDFSLSATGGNYVTIAGLNVSGAEPILGFAGYVVPEPSSVALFGLGGVFCVLYAVRRRCTVTFNHSNSIAGRV